jgi:selenocysteine lyase/cysteine desulfurase
MAGEGVCFMHCPDGFIPRPRATGWFAEFGALEAERDDTVAYGPGGARFYGATFDPSGLYRLNAAMDWLVATGQDAASMATHSWALQARLLDNLATAGGLLSVQQLVQPVQASRGRFLSFRTSKAGMIDARLRDRNVIVDHRGDLLRIGFSIYQDASDVDALLKALAVLDQ